VGVLSIAVSGPSGTSPGWRLLAQVDYFRVVAIPSLWLPGLQQRPMKTGGRLVKHARYYWLLLAESGLTRRLFGAMVRRIAALPVATG